MLMLFCFDTCPALTRNKTPSLEQLLYDFFIYPLAYAASPGAGSASIPVFCIFAAEHLDIVGELDVTTLAFLVITHPLGRGKNVPSRDGICKVEVLNDPPHHSTEYLTPLIRLD